MRVLALAAATLALAMTGGNEPLKLKSGDSVVITSPYGGEFKIMPDGAIYGRGFGRLALEGKTWEEAQAAVRKALAKFVKPEEVNLTLKDLRREVVYLVGMSGGRGPVELTPKLSLRQLLASAPLGEDADLIDVQVFRGNSKLCTYNAAKLLAGDEATPDQNLQADDVVTLAPASFVRIWVTGLVLKAGQLKLPAGTDVYKAIAEAGGYRWSDLEPDTSVQQGGKIIVNRGPNQYTFPIRAEEKAQPFALEAGDTVTVVAPELRRITIAGQVNRPGEVVMRGEHTLTGAIAMAGGCDAEGTLTNVLVLRKGELYQQDASKPATFELESGDLVYVQRNVRAFMVLGEVAKAGRVVMKDSKNYRLSDALAESGGLSGRGTLRRVFVAHPGPDGKMKVAQYNLDEYLKDGKLEANPEIFPGDCILFGQPKGITMASISQFMSGALLLENLVNR